MLLRRSDIEPPTLIVIISRYWDEDPATLYDRTRFAWPFSWRERHRAERAEVILASYNREIAGVFTADEWLPATAENFPGLGNEPDRYGFNGREASPDIQNLYVGRRTTDDLRSYGRSFLFVNCP